MPKAKFKSLPDKFDKFASLAGGAAGALALLPVDTLIGAGGDSILAANGIDSFFHWALAIALGRYRCAAYNPNGDTDTIERRGSIQGFAGKTADNFLNGGFTLQSPEVGTQNTPPVDLLIALGCKIAVLLLGTNDISQGRSAAQIIASLGAIYAKLRAAGIRIVAVQILPSSGHNAGQVIIRDTVNAWIATQAARDLKVVDSAFFDPATMTIDGLHPVQNGAYQLGKRVAVPLAEWAVPEYFYSAGNPPVNYNVPSTRYDMQGTGGSRFPAAGSGQGSVEGVIAAGYNLNGYDASTGARVTGSKSTLADGTTCEQVVVSGTPTTAGQATLFDFTQTINASAGEAVEAYCEVELGASPVGINGIGLLMSNGLGSILASNVDLGANVLWGADTPRLVLRTIPVITGAFNATRYPTFGAGIRANTTPSLTAKVSKWGYRKRTLLAA